jgi:hypothetical protein
MAACRLVFPLHRSLRSIPSQSEVPGEDHFPSDALQTMPHSLMCEYVRPNLCHLLRLGTQMADDECGVD